MPDADFKWLNDNRWAIGEVYRLALELCGDEAMVKRDVLPNAVHDAHAYWKERHNFCDSRKSKPFAPGFSPRQALQLGVLKNLQRVDESHRDDPSWPLLRYLAALVQFCLWRSSSALAAGIGSVLNGADANSVALLSQHLAHRPIANGQVTEWKVSIGTHLHKYVHNLVEFDGEGQPVTRQVVKAPNDVVTRMLSRMIPLGTEHLLDGEDFSSYLERARGGGSWHVAMAHLWLDQAVCFDTVLRMRVSFDGKFAHWSLPLPKNRGFEPSPTWTPKDVPELHDDRRNELMGLVYGHKVKTLR